MFTTKLAVLKVLNCSHILRLICIDLVLKSNLTIQAVIRSIWLMIDNLLYTTNKSFLDLFITTFLEGWNF